MNFTTELIVLSIVIILLFIRPNALVKFSKSTIGKVVFVSIIILSSSINPLIGLFFATLMVLLLETSYEGFKEGFPRVRASGTASDKLGTYKTFGETDSNVDSIVLADPGNKFASVDIENKVDLSGAGLAPLTLITEKLDASSIIIQPPTGPGTLFTTLDQDISFVRVSTSITGTPSPPTSSSTGDMYDISFIYSGTPSTPAAAIITSQTTSNMVHMTVTDTGTDEYTIQSSTESPTIEVITGDYNRKLTHKSNDVTNLYLTFKPGTDPIETNNYVVDPDSTERKVYKVNDVSNTFIATLGTATTSNNPHNTPLQILDHKHDFTYTGDNPHKHEAFTSYNRDDETIQDVKPYQESENTFLSDLTGESVCSTNMCDRIDAETKMLFPISSNNHCPTN